MLMFWCHKSFEGLPLSNAFVEDSLGEKVGKNIKAYKAVDEVEGCCYVFFL